MKRPSNALLALALALGLAAGASAADLFSTVPATDPSVAQLRKLEAWGFLPAGTVSGPLTRYDAAAFILKAEQSAREKGRLVVAQADLDLTEGEQVVTHKDRAPGEAAEAPTPEATPTLEEISKTFKTLQDAYDYELTQVKDEAKRIKDRIDKMEAQDYPLWKRVRALANDATISLHGFGRAHWNTTKQFGNLSSAGPVTTVWNGVQLITNPLGTVSLLPLPFNRGQGRALLDLDPTGTACKELKWNAVLRISSDLTAGDAGNTYGMERVTVHLDPPFLTSVFGDFDMHWTPLTLWNRNSLDKLFAPEILSRWDDYEKYPLFINKAPDMPLRGVKAGTTMAWPKSKILDTVKVDTFAHMLRSGFSKGYIAHRYTGWIFGAMGEVKARKYLSVAGYSLIFDEPLDTDLPGSLYNPLNVNSWAQQYRVSSIQPRLEAVKGDLTVGAEMEVAASKYRDDKRDAARVITDWAALGGPYFKYRESSLKFQYVNVGYSFFSPLAQLRQRNDCDGSLTTAPIRLSSDAAKALGRAGDLFKFYNRLTDNVMPYGLASPNRQGFGGDLDLKTGKVVRLKAQVYSLKEIRENQVIDVAGTGVTVVDAWGPVTVLERKYLYLNMGPQVDLAAWWGLKSKLLWSMNVRNEKTRTTIGNLQGTALDLGLTVGLKPSWDVGLAGGSFSGKGVEMGYLGTTLARYSYQFDASDRGYYTPFDVDQTATYGALSFVFRIGRHSKLTVDGLMRSEKGLLLTAGTLKTQTVDAAYEITF